MLTAEQAAEYFIYHAKLDENETITNLRLNKLLYFAQLWHMDKFHTPLFDDDFKAWEYGPVIPSIYQKYKRYGKNNIEGDFEGFNPDGYSLDDIDTLTSVSRVYGRYSTPALVNLSHDTEPWKNTAKTETIKKSIMEDYVRTCSLMKDDSLDKLYRNAITGYMNNNGVQVFPKDFDDEY